MAKPFFSIIIPTLNEEKYLPRLLACLKKQTFKNFETIVVDANSQDQTLKKAKKYPGIKLIVSKKKNPAFQRNLGAQKAKGKYLIFIDADVSFNQEVLKKSWQFIKNKKPACFFLRFKFNSSKLSYLLINFLGNWLFYFFNKLGLSLISGQFLVIKKSVFQQVKGYNSQLVLSEEHNLIKKIKKQGQKAAYLRTAVVNASTRRIKKEGLIKFLLKYLYFIIYEQIKGPIYKKPPLNYPMGGSWYG